MIAYAHVAASHTAAATSLVEKLKAAILFPLMGLMIAAAIVVFLYGVFEYVRDSDSDDGRAKGRSHMLFGIIGLVVMVSAVAILSIATKTFGI